MSTTTAGAIASGSFAAYCLVALVAQQLVRARGARVVLWVAAGLAAAGALVVASAPSAALLAVGVLVAGSAAGASSPALVVAVSSVVAPTVVQRSQAVVNAGTGIGVALTGVVVLAAPQAWRLVGAAVAVVVLVAVVDRCACWPVTAPSRSAVGRHGAPMAGLARPLLGAVAAGVGSAAVWTFGRDLVTTTGGLPERTSAVLWVLLGAGAVLGGLSGDLVRVVGLRWAWVTTVSLTATATAMISLLPGVVGVVAVAGVVFGGAYTALSGVLISWAGALRSHDAGRATASLFIALTAGQAVGAAASGALLGGAGVLVVFLGSAAILVVAVAASPSRGTGLASRTCAPSPAD